MYKRQVEQDQEAVHKVVQTLEQVILLQYHPLKEIQVDILQAKMDQAKVVEPAVEQVQQAMIPQEQVMVEMEVTELLVQ